MLCADTTDMTEDDYPKAWLIDIFAHHMLLIFCFNVCFRGVRPFGVSLLLAGWDEDEERPYLYQCDPSVS